MERLAKGRLITHLEMNNLRGDSQHGFRNKRSCMTSLLDFFAQVIDTYDTDNNKAVDLVYRDFQKAFDKVPHERLMVKFNAHDIQGDAARWIRNWLAGRRQRICIIIIILESAVQGRERVRTLYQSQDPNPTQPTHGRKKKIKQ